MSPKGHPNVPPAWSCHRCGACCTRPSALLVTDAELDEMILATSGRITPTTRQVPGGFVLIKAAPCPFYYQTDKPPYPQRRSPRKPAVLHACACYDVRPYNCRRYLCGRSSCDEPWDPKPVPDVVLHTKALRLYYRANQAKHMTRAWIRGWGRKPNDTT